MINPVIILTGIITSIISFIGYPGVVILMALESTTTPVPSELVMPFAGYLASTGEFNIFAVIISGTIGSIIGSTFSYFMGRKYGVNFAKKYGKYLLFSNRDLELTVGWFRKYGDKTIFISRFIPIVRHFISIPAGVARMNFWKFLAYTAIGSMAWVSILTYAGYRLGKEWETITSVSDKFSLFIIILLIIGVGLYIWRHIKHTGD